MSIQKYHVSKNLFDGTLVQGAVTDAGILVSSSTRVRGEYISVRPNAQYTLSTDQSIKCIYAYNNQERVDLIFSIGVTGRHERTFTTPDNCYSICIAIMSNEGTSGDITPQDVEFVMLNSGSTALPYEPYGNTWKSIPYRKYGTETDTITSLPADVIADGQSASANIIGNMVQSGTPSPSSIIMPDECGNKTANLYNDATTEQGYRIQWTTGNAYADATALMSDYIPVSTGDYRISSPVVVVGYDSAKAYVGVYRADLLTWEKRMAGEITAFNVASDAGISYIKLLTYGEATPISSTTMLNAGTTTLPLEPYGYKIPILCGNTTTNVYLGEVQSTRNIEKYVFTGQETPSWAAVITDTDAYQFPDETSGYKREKFICSHMPVNTYSTTTNTHGYIGQRLTLCFDKAMGLDTTTKVQQYLADQYAAGTPVTVWYVLATPTTGIVNEPIRKIGNYADSVAVTGIPTTGTAESFDIDTTLKPSEVDLTYHGWHEHSDTKFTT